MRLIVYKPKSTHELLKFQIAANEQICTISQRARNSKLVARGQNWLKAELLICKIAKLLIAKSGHSVSRFLSPVSFR